MTKEEDCKAPAKWVCYCRNPPKPNNGRPRRRPRLSDAEKVAIEQRMRELEPQVRPNHEPLPSMKTRTLTKAPHDLLDQLNEELMIALFRMPWLVPGAVKRFLDKKYRREYPVPQERYNKILQEFVHSHGVGPIPTLYEYVVLKTCLIANE